VPGTAEANDASRNGSEAYLGARIDRGLSVECPLWRIANHMLVASQVLYGVEPIRGTHLGESPVSVRVSDAGPA
jgi:hypothetical protein